MAAAIEHPLTELEAFERQVAGCTKCRLAQGRTQVVFGIGDPAADLMFVLTSFDGFDLLFSGRGMTADQVAEAFIETAERALLR